MSKVNYADLEPEAKAIAEQIVKDRGWNEDLAAVAAMAGVGSIDVIEQAMAKSKIQEETEDEREARINRLKAQHQAARDRGDMHQAISLKNVLYKEGVAV